VKPTRRRKGGRRGRRVASLIREVVSRALVTELSDPRMGLVTVTEVEVSADLRLADVRVSVLGEPKAQRACMEAIAHSRGHVQERVADAIDMKYCPVLRFHLDESVKKSVAVSALIAKARAEDEAARADRIRRGVESPDDAEAEPPPDEV
jgi:ribosome-binding factor A